MKSDTAWREGTVPLWKAESESVGVTGEYIGFKNDDAIWTQNTILPNGEERQGLAREGRDFPTTYFVQRSFVQEIRI